MAYVGAKYATPSGMRTAQPFAATVNSVETISTAILMISSNLNFEATRQLFRSIVAVSLPSCLN